MKAKCPSCGCQHSVPELIQLSADVERHIAIAAELEDRLQMMEAEIGIALTALQKLIPQEEK